MLQRILSKMRKAIEDYHMISDGDHIAVGVSGGKDSLVMLLGLKELQRFLPVKFEITAITLSLGFPDFDKEALIRFYQLHDISWHIEETNIGPLVFDKRKETSPCALCAKMKRGTIHETAKKLGCNKVAFGHHMNDAIETLVMSLLYEGRIHCFSPVTELDRTGITLIRPLIYADERHIKAFVEHEGLPVIKSGCPADGGTKRTVVKQKILDLKSENPQIEAALFGAIQRSHLNGWKPMGYSSQYKKGHPENVQFVIETPLTHSSNPTAPERSAKDSEAVLNDSNLKAFLIDNHLETFHTNNNTAITHMNTTLETVQPVNDPKPALLLSMYKQLMHPVDIGQAYTNVLEMAAKFLGANSASLYTYQQDGSLRKRQQWQPSAFPFANDIGHYMKDRTSANSNDMDAPITFFPWLAQVIQVEQVHVALAIFELPANRFPDKTQYTMLHDFEEMMTYAHERRFLDITRNNELIQEKETAANRNAFFASMSHELRNPMNAVIGYAELLEITSLTPHQRKLISEVKGASEMILTLVNDILDFAKIEAGQLKLEKIVFPLRACVENAVSINAAQAQRKGLEVGIFIQPGLPEMVLGDPTRLKQVITNLVGNAVKFTARGYVLIEVFGHKNALRKNSLFTTEDPYATSFAASLFPYLQSNIIPGQIQMLEPQAIEPLGTNHPYTPSEDDDIPNKDSHMLYFRVTDSGIGMSDAVIKALYQPYQQADTSVARHFGGTGLGLAISSQLISLMHGDISVTSKEGSGSSFAVSLPFEPVEKEPSGEDAAQVKYARRVEPQNKITLPFEPAEKEPSGEDTAQDKYARRVEPQNKITLPFEPVEKELSGEDAAQVKYTEWYAPQNKMQNRQSSFNAEWVPDLMREQNISAKRQLLIIEPCPMYRDILRGYLAGHLSNNTEGMAFAETNSDTNPVLNGSYVCNFAETASEALVLGSDLPPCHAVLFYDPLPDDDANTFSTILSLLPATMHARIIRMTKMTADIPVHSAGNSDTFLYLTQPIHYTDLMYALETKLTPEAKEQAIADPVLETEADTGSTQHRKTEQKTLHAADGALGVFSHVLPQQKDGALGVNPVLPQQKDGALGVLNPVFPQQMDGALGVFNPVFPQQMDSALGVNPVLPQQKDGALGVLNPVFPHQKKVDASPQTTQAKKETNPRILLVDDNQVNRDILENMLKVYGLSCDTATNGLEAVEQYQQQPYDIIFMDCQMPVMDGETATKMIRDIEKQLIQTRLDDDTLREVDTPLVQTTNCRHTFHKKPLTESGKNGHESKEPLEGRQKSDGHAPKKALIAALTALISVEDRQKCTDAGVDTHLTKPILMENLFIWLDNSLLELGFLQKNETGWPVSHPAEESVLYLMRDFRMSRRDAIQLVRVFFADIAAFLAWVQKNQPLSPYADAEKPTADNYADKIRQWTHRLRGSSGNLHLNAFYDRLTLLESVVQARDQVQVRLIITDLHDLSALYL